MSKGKVEVAPATRERAGWRPREFAQIASLSPSYVARILSEGGAIAPRSVRVGNRRIVIEPPSDWLSRLAAQQHNEEHAPEAA